MASISKGKQPAGYYPTQWSDWEWDDKSQRYRRYRLRAADDYEIEWEGGNSNEVPRYLPPIMESPVTYTTAPALSSFPASTSAGVNDLVRGLQRANISSRSGFEQGTAFQSPNPRITTKDIRTNEERFDPNYRVHSQWEFKWGRVFKILWAEPKGNVGNGEDSDAETSIREGKHGERFYEKVRRFLIVNQMDGHCICLPINTYSRQGTLKKGVHANHHTIIYTDKSPQYFAGEKEKGLTRAPICMTPDDPRHKLLKGSRLNYAKPYTVEYNVKVWFIGRIHRKSEAHVAADYNDVHPPMQAPPLASGVSYDTASTTSYTQGGPTSSYPPYNQYPQSGYTMAPMQPLSGPNTDSGYPPGPSISESEGYPPQSTEQYPTGESGGFGYDSGSQSAPQGGVRYDVPGESSSQGATQQGQQASRSSGQSGERSSSRDTASRGHHSKAHHKSRDRDDEKRHGQKKYK